jgi:hypothetical protein
VTVLALLPTYEPVPETTSALDPGHPPQRTDPVAPAQRSADAAAKASRCQLADGTPTHSFRRLLDHLGTLTRNQVQFAQQPHAVTTKLLVTPTPTQWRAFELVGAPIPLMLK